MRPGVEAGGDVESQGCDVHNDNWDTGHERHDA